MEVERIMKNKIFELLVCMMLMGTFFVVTPNMVHAYEEDGFIYTLSGDPQVATITGYNGTNNDIIIPSAFDGGKYKTVAIGNSAFNSDKGHLITSVTIPDSVTTIGTYSFLDCSALKSIYFGSNVSTIGQYAFFHCYALVSVTIPNKVTILEDALFGDCTSLTSVIIPNSVKTIRNSTFYNCPLSPMILPESINFIGDWAFSNCDLLSSVTIPNEVTFIGNFTFSSCSSLTSVTIGNNVKTIWIMAFYECPFSSITIPDSVTTIWDSAFLNCDSLNSINIPDSVTSIGNSTFSHCSSLANVIIGNNVKTIGNYSFSDCPFVSLSIPNNVTAIGKGAFYHCTSLTNLYIGNKVTTIKEDTFYYCTALKSVTIGESVKTIENFSFALCQALNNVTIPKNVSTIGDGVFLECSSLKAIYVSTENMNYASIDGVLYNKANTTLIECPSGKTGTFFNIPSMVNTIGNYAFYQCYNFNNITIPNSVTSIGKHTFSYCHNMNTVIIGNNVKTIGDFAFEHCYSLSNVGIPNSVKTIGDGIFLMCSLLTEINISEGNMNYVCVDGILYNKDITTLIWFPEGKTGIFNITNTVRTIGNYAFNSCQLNSVYFPNNVESIGEFAFYSCINLKNVTIPNSVISIGKDAFTFCSALNTVKIGNNVKTIGDYAFYSCPIVSLYIPNSVTSINEHAFGKCSFLTDVTIGKNVKIIGNNTFYDCTNLESISFLGLQAPTKDLSNWITGTPETLRGHAYINSDFPKPPNGEFYKLKMGDYIPAPPMYGTPSPTNGSTGNQLSLTWRIPINDPEGDQFSWTIECSNGQKNNSTGYETNDTKSLLLSGLQNSKHYTVWVNATDPTGSGLYTREWYTFNTKGTSSGGDSNGNGNGNGNGGTLPTQNQKPVADLSFGKPYQGFVNTEITFNGSKSHDTDGNITKWFWNFGDNTNATGEIVAHMYSQAGNYIVTLTVTDNEGATDTDTTNCIIKQPNRAPITPTITGPTNGTKNTLYNYTAFSTDADNDTIQYTFNWGDTNSQSSRFMPNATNHTANHSWTAAGRYNITLTVSDNQSTSSSKITVYIDATQISEIGYLLDNNSDGRYDAFYSEELQQTLAIQVKDGSYNIDNNGDKKWDYTYNAAKGLSIYKQPEDTPGFELVFVLSAIAVSILLWRKKRNE
jgi:PKD repeat protein